MQVELTENIAGGLAGGSGNATTKDPSTEVPLAEEPDVIQVSDRAHKAHDPRNPTWCTGQEDSPEWDQHLKKQGKTWLKLMVAVASLPCAVFMYPVLYWVFTGQWMSAALGALYKDGPYSVPAVLEIHFFLASFMLFILIAQVVLTGVMKLAIPKTKKEKRIHAAHRCNGMVLAGFIVTATTLGTVALAFCDMVPKRGPESIFFVLIGICIVITCIKGVGFAARGLYGLHFQYMTYTVFIVSSPGWNRFTTICIRLFVGGTKAFTSEAYKKCFDRYLWKGHTYHWTWSFFFGELWMALWWIAPCSPFKAPFFKIFSSGFWMVAFQVLMLVVCLGSMFNSGAWVTKDVFTCTTNQTINYDNFTQGVNALGLYNMQQAYGVCTPFAVEELQGTPWWFLRSARTGGVGDIAFYKHYEATRIKAEETRTRLLQRSEGLKLDCLLQNVGIHLNQTLLREYFGYDNHNFTTCQQLLKDTQANVAFLNEEIEPL